MYSAGVDPDSDECDAYTDADFDPNADENADAYSDYHGDAYPYSNRNADPDRNAFAASAE